jgi:hypothetical protein
MPSFLFCSGTLSQVDAGGGYTIPHCTATWTAVPTTAPISPTYDAYTVTVCTAPAAYSFSVHYSKCASPVVKTGAELHDWSGAAGWYLSACSGSSSSGAYGGGYFAECSVTWSSVDASAYYVEPILGDGEFTATLSDVWSLLFVLLLCGMFARGVQAGMTR